MKKSLNSNDISQLLKKTKPIYTQNFKFRAVPSNALRVGFAVNRRCGSAVLRNRFKRQMRADAESLSKIYSPLKILIIAEKNIKKILNMKSELDSVFKTVYGK